MPHVLFTVDIMRRIVPCISILVVAIVAVSTSAAHASRRVALVIGNSMYAYAVNLRNPRNDAVAMAAAFRRMGFDKVVEHLDVDKRALELALSSFALEAEKSDIAVVYYAGHGVEVDGRNYLVPSDAKLASSAVVEAEAVRLSALTTAVADARRLRLIILDACRNNPFRSRMVSRGKRSIGRGLAHVEPSENELVAFAAAGGTEADDGDDRHSPYTSALLKHIETPDLEVGQLFRNVRDEVLQATQRRQTPHVYGTLGREQIYLTFNNGSGSSFAERENMRLKAEIDRLRRAQVAIKSETEALRRRADGNVNSPNEAKSVIEDARRPHKTSPRIECDGVPGIWLAATGGYLYFRPGGKAVAPSKLSSGTWTCKANNISIHWRVPLGNSLVDHCSITHDGAQMNCVNNLGLPFVRRRKGAS